MCCRIWLAVLGVGCDRVTPPFHQRLLMMCQKKYKLSKLQQSRIATHPCPGLLGHIFRFSNPPQTLELGQSKTRLNTRKHERLRPSKYKMFDVDISHLRAWTSLKYPGPCHTSVRQIKSPVGTQRKPADSTLSPEDRCEPPSQRAPSGWAACWCVQCVRFVAIVTLLLDWAAYWGKTRQRLRSLLPR